MSLTSASFTVHFYLQKVCIQPYFANLLKEQVNLDARYNGKRYTIYRKIVYFTWIYLTTFVTGRLVWLIYHWKTFTTYYVQQTILYMATCCGHIVPISLLITQAKHYTELLYIVNQAINLVRKSHLPVSKTSSIRLSFVYILSFCISMISPGMLAIPFTIEYDPYQLIFGKGVFIQIWGGMTYAVMLFSGLMPLLSVLLMLIIYLEKINICTTHLTQSVEAKNKVNFSGDYQSFQMTKILITVANEVFTTFLTILVFVGVLLASLSAVAAIKISHLLHIVTYIALVGIAIASFAVAMVLTYLAGLPLRNLLSFKRSWLNCSLGKGERKTLNACKSVGFSLGCYGTANSVLGLHICDDIVHNIVTLALIDILQ